MNVITLKLRCKTHTHTRSQVERNIETTLDYTQRHGNSSQPQVLVNRRDRRTYKDSHGERLGKRSVPQEDQECHSFWHKHSTNKAQ